MRRIAFCLFLLCLSAAASRSQETTAYQTDPKFAAAMAEGKKLARERNYTFAIDAYKKASKIAGGKDASALHELLSLHMETGSYKDALKFATALEEIATTPKQKADAYLYKGNALYQQAGEKGKPELLHAADDAYKAALALDPKSTLALYMDGRTLARLGQMEAAQTTFQQCAKCLSPNDPSYTRVQHFAANPALSTAKMAPSFVVTSLDGTKFNLDEMGGRVMLIDFWATWCGPCREELPHIKKIAKEFAGQPLVIISVSWDADETKWKDFIGKNEMTWVQYRDSDHNLGTLFNINAIPHYFTIDSDGVLTAEMMGSGADVEGKLKKLVAKAKAAAVPGTVQTATN